MSDKSLIRLSLLLSFQISCGKTEEKNQDLRERNLALENQLGAKDREIADAREQSAEDLKLKADEKTAVEKDRDNALAELDRKVTALRKAEEELNDTKAGVIAFKAKQQQLIMESMKPSDGLWILDAEFPFAGPRETCDVYLRFESSQISLYRIFVCGESIQLDKEEVKRIGVERGAGWNGTMGLVIETASVTSSCQSEGSSIPQSPRYALDFSQATASGNTTSSNALTAAFGDVGLTFSSAATQPMLGKNRSCESIVNRAKLESQQDNPSLQKAAKACQLTEASEGLSCISSPLAN